MAAELLRNFGRQIDKTMRTFFTLFCSVYFVILASGQSILIDGYAYEKDNRGYLNQVLIELVDIHGSVLQRMDSNQDGYFALQTETGFRGVLRASKDLFYQQEIQLDFTGKPAGHKEFVKLEMERKPGYIFDVTIAPARDSATEEVDAILGSWVEIYNNTTEEQVLSLKDYQQPNFQYTFEKGNHYTVMVRADGYFTKRMEAFVDVKGCILCFEGIGDVRPNVTDNLTQGNEMGTMLANIELQPANVNDKLVIQNIYYDYNKADLTDESAEALDDLIEVLRDNPSIILELGSHTDSRGDQAFNEELSSRRATVVVDYLLAHGIESRRIVARGYGESSLVNDCGNQSDCSEKEHAANRRTELTVIGFLREDPLADKTLSDIKEEERYAALLAEIQSGDQVMQIEAGGEIPEEIKRDLEKQKQRSGEQSEEKDASLSDELNQVVKEIKEIVDEEENVKSIEQEQVIFNPETDEEKVIVTARDVQSIPDASEGRLINKKEVDEDVAIETQRDELNRRGLRMLPQNYSGVKAQIVVSSSLIADDHPLVLQYGTVYYYYTGTAYAYLVGEFASREMAREHINENIKQDYPDAFLVSFINGKRM